MTLLDPKYADMADLLSLVSDISDQLADIGDGVDAVNGEISEMRTDVRKPKHGGKRKHRGRRGNSSNPYQQGVRHAIAAVLNDLHDRASLIPVGDDDSEYDEHCTCCLLRKNGYPHLAELFSEATP